MKHRTISAFIITLALMGGVSQGVRQLSDLKEAAGKRLSAGFWNAVLGMHGQKVSNYSVESAFVGSSETGDASFLEASCEMAKGETRKAASEKRDAKTIAYEGTEEERIKDESTLNSSELAQLEEFEMIVEMESLAKGPVRISVPQAPKAMLAARPKEFVFDVKNVAASARLNRQALVSSRARGDHNSAPETKVHASESAKETKTVQDEGVKVWRFSHTSDTNEGESVREFTSNENDCEMTN